MIKFLLNIKLVKLKGTNLYAVRKGWFFYKYADLRSVNLWWPKKSTWYSECLTEDVGLANLAFSYLTDRHEVIK